MSSPEILVFLFFMITDPKTTPRGTRSRALYAVSIGLLAALLNAPARTEFWSKVAVLGALAIVCAARPLFERVPVFRLEPRRLAAAVALLLVGYTAAMAGAGIRARPEGAAAALTHSGRLPRIAILRRGWSSRSNSIPGRFPPRRRKKPKQVSRLGASLRIACRCLQLRFHKWRAFYEDCAARLDIEKQRHCGRVEEFHFGEVKL